MTDPDSNVAIVRQFMTATGAEHRHVRANLLHDEFVVNEAGGLPFSGEYHGAKGFFDLMTRITEVVDLSAGAIATDPWGDQRVVARFSLRFTSRCSGSSVEMKIVEIYTLRDDRISELDVYYKDPSAVTAVLTEYFDND